MEQSEVVMGQDRTEKRVPSTNLLKAMQHEYKIKSVQPKKPCLSGVNLLGMAENSNRFIKAGVSNIRPAGQIRPVAWLDPARGMIL